MSTRSSIAVQLEDGTVRAVYCHHDGYFTGVGEALLLGHDSQAAALDLVNQGDLSSVVTPKEPGRTSAFPYTDRGDPYVEPRVYSDLPDYTSRVGEQIGDNGYRYIFARDPKTGKSDWYVWGRCLNYHVLPESDDDSLLALGAGVVAVKVEKALNLPYLPSRED